jgi:hypothetical protein
MSWRQPAMSMIALRQANVSGFPPMRKRRAWMGHPDLFDATPLFVE